MFEPEFTTSQIDDRILEDPEMLELAKNDDSTEFNARKAGIYKQFGYNEDGTPLRTAKRAIKKVADVTGIPEGVVQFGASSVMPAIGGAVGALAGAPGGPAGIIAGGAAGSVLGAAQNSLLGIDEPMSATDIGVNAVAPLVGPLVGKAGRAGVEGLKRGLPGTGAGLVDYLEGVMKRTVNGVRVTKEEVNTARGVLNGLKDFDMDAFHTKAIFNEESASVAKQALLGIPDSEPYLKALNRVISESKLGGKGKVKFKDLMVLEEGFNRIKGGKPDEIWAAASGKIIDDIEAVASNPKMSAATKLKAQEGVNAFKAFITLNRKHQADEQLVKMFTPGTGAGRVIKPTTGDPTINMFDAKAFQNLMDNDPVLTKALSASERKQIKDAVADIGFIRNPPSEGGGLNAYTAAKRFGIGGVLGGAMTGWSPLGVLAGASVEETLRQAVMSPTGRNAVKYLAKKGRGNIDMLELQKMTGQIAMGAASGTVAGMRGGENHSPNLENME